MAGASHTVYLIRTGGARRPGAARTRLRLVAAVLGVLVSALDAWLTAVLGVRPLIPAARRTVTGLYGQCRDWATGVIDAEIIDDPEQPDRLGRRVWL